MKILLTNDDGINADGLEAIFKVLDVDHEVWILAPDRQRSGVSNAMTLDRPARLHKHGTRRFSCTGTPVDCVMLGCLGALPEKPDIIVSGINMGGNLGVDIIYSGTCGAARQAAIFGLPGIALSCVPAEGAFNFNLITSFVRDHLDILVGFCNKHQFINVNAPSSHEAKVDAHWCIPSEHGYNDQLHALNGPDGHTYCFVIGKPHISNAVSNTDFETVMAGKISVSPILVHSQVPRGFEPRDF